MFERTSLYVGLAAVLIGNITGLPAARADTLAFSCGFSSSQIAEYNRARSLGISTPDLGQRFAFNVDTGTRTAVVLGPPRATYPATITGSSVSWSTPPDEDGETASFAFDLSSNVLRTVDPDGAATLWDCAKQ